MSSLSARCLGLAVAALVGGAGSAAASADPVVHCQHAIESGARAFSAELLHAAIVCGRPGSPPFAGCLDSEAVHEKLDHVRGRWAKHTTRACVGTNFRSDLGYLDTCAAPPSSCTFPSGVLDVPGESNDLLDCLACRIGESLRGGAVALFAGQPVSNRCHAALARNGLKALRLLLAELAGCAKTGAATSIAGCLEGSPHADKVAVQRAEWRSAVETACANTDPFMNPGYPHYCSGQAPAIFGEECPDTAPPCTFQATSSVSAHKNPNNLFDSEDENDLVDCLTCQIEEAALAVARDVYGANLCCASDGCRTVRTRTGCRELGGQPAYYRVDSVATGPICEPHGITVGPDGTLYIADSRCDRVSAVSADGTVRILATNLYFPTGIAADAAGNVYVSLRCEHQVLRISPSGAIAPYAGTGTAGHSGDGGPATAAELVAPDGVAVDTGGTVYIPESGFLPLACSQGIVSFDLEHVRLVDPFGTIETFAGAGPGGSAGEGGPALDAQLGIPYGISAAPDGSVLIGEAGLERVLRVDRAGVLTRVAGRPTSPFGSYSGDGGPAALARFYEACGVSQTADGKVFVADMINNRVRMVDPLGSIIAVVGTGLASNDGPSGDGGPGLLAAGGCPEDVAVGPDGRVYYSDLDANRIRVLTLERY